MKFSLPHDSVANLSDHCNEDRGNKTKKNICNDAQKLGSGSYFKSNQQLQLIEQVLVCYFSDTRSNVVNCQLSGFVCFQNLENVYQLNLSIENTLSQVYNLLSGLEKLFKLIS